MISMKSGLADRALYADLLFLNPHDLNAKWIWFKPESAYLIYLTNLIKSRFN